MKIVGFERIAAAEWDFACDISAQAWLFHRNDWVNIETEYFVCANYSFGIEAAGGIVGIQPLYISDGSKGTGGERLLHSGIHRHSGLALSDALSRSERKQAEASSMRRIFQIADELDVDRIQLNTHNLTPENLSTDRNEVPFWVKEYEFFLGLNFGSTGMIPAPGLSTCGADQIVSLTPSEDELFGGLGESCRRAIRKARAEGVKLTLGSSADIPSYYEIALKSATRTGESLLPVDYYQEVSNRLMSKRQCALLFATHENKLAAGLLLLVDKNAASFMAGVSDPEYLPMRVNDFLHWSAMLWAKGANLHHYRLGPVFPEVPADWPIAKVSAFKGKFGGRSVTIIQGSYFRHPEKYLEAAIGHITDLCKRKRSPD